jgi:hypothetical protein
MHVIYEAGMDVLPLIVESVALLPPDRRWRVTFSTYFTKAPAGVQIQWRFLLDGTPEASALRRNPHANLIDLCSTLGPADGGELVAAARSGKLVYAEQTTRILSGSSARLQAWTGQAEQEQKATAPVDHRPSVPLAEQRPAVALRKETAEFPLNRRPTPHQQRRMRKVLTALSVVTISIALLLVGMLLGTYVNSVPRSMEVAQNDGSAPPNDGASEPRVSIEQDAASNSVPAPKDESPIEADPQEATSDEVAEPSGNNGPGGTPVESGSAKDSRLQATPDVEVATAAPEPAGNSAEPTDRSSAPRGVGVDESQITRVLLPPRPTADAYGKVTTNPISLPEIANLRSGEVTLQLDHHLTEALDRPNEQIELQPDGSVNYSNKDSLYNDKPVVPRRVASFRTSGQQLEFEWAADSELITLQTDAQPWLRWCILNVRTGDRTEHVLLNYHRSEKAPQIELQEAKNYRIVHSVYDFSGRKPTFPLFATVKFEGLADFSPTKPKRLAVGKSASVHFKGAGKVTEGTELLELRVEFRQSPTNSSHYQLAVVPYVKKLILTADLPSFSSTFEPLDKSTIDKNSQTFRSAKLSQAKLGRDAAKKLPEPGNLDSDTSIRLAKEQLEPLLVIKNRLRTIKDEHEARSRDLSTLTKTLSDFDKERIRTQSLAKQKVAEFAGKLSEVDSRTVEATGWKKQRARWEVLDSLLNRLAQPLNDALQEVNRAATNVHLIETQERLHERLLNRMQELGTGRIAYTVEAKIDGQTILLVKAD